MIKIMDTPRAAGRALACGIGVVALLINGHQLVTDPWKDDPAETFVVGWTFTSTGTLHDVAQDAITSNLIDVPSPAPDRYADLRMTDVSSGSWFRSCT